jgi:hypothetical protein
MSAQVDASPLVDRLLEATGARWVPDEEITVVPGTTSTDLLYTTAELSALAASTHPDDIARAAAHLLFISAGARMAARSFSNGDITATKFSEYIVVVLQVLFGSAIPAGGFWGGEIPPDLRPEV